MKKISGAGFSLIVVLALVVFSPAHASPVQWTLQDVTFNDGGTASGSFFYDADTNIYSAINVTTTAGSVLAGQSFASLLSGGAETAFALNMAPFPSATLIGLPVLLLRFGTALTNAGGTSNLVLGTYTPFFPAQGSYEAVCVINDVCGAPIPLSNIRLLTAGSVTAVPIPAAVWLFGSGLILLGRFRHKQA